MSNLISNPFTIFTDKNGDPLEDGYVFIGEANLNPLSNPQQAYWDAELTIPAYNIRTKGGYASNNGTPGQLWAENAYSILVQNKNGTFIWSSLEEGAEAVGDTTTVLTVDTVSDLRALLPVEDNIQVSVGGSVTVGDGLMGPLYYWNSLSDAVDDGVSVIQPDDATGDGRWLWLNDIAPTESVSLDNTDIDDTSDTAYAAEEWSISTAYLEADATIVWYGSLWYRCIQDSTGDQPDTSPLYWEPIIRITLDFQHKNRIFLVDTDSSSDPFVIVVPDGDFDGQSIELSNRGSEAIQLRGEGIEQDLSINNATLLWLVDRWSVAIKGSSTALPRGYFAATLSEYSSDLAPDIKSGSTFDNNGVAIEVLVDTTPTGYSGISISTTFYLYYEEVTSSFIYSATAPTWSDSLQGWYNSNDRALFSIYKDSSGILYSNKKNLKQLSEDKEKYSLKEINLTSSEIFNLIKTWVSSTGDFMGVIGDYSQDGGTEGVVSGIYRSSATEVEFLRMTTAGVTGTTSVIDTNPTNFSVIRLSAVEGGTQ